ncbi:hypothetical protein D041_3845, partial [Vibrio parahaemolyticus EKP-008]
MFTLRDFINRDGD